MVCYHCKKPVPIEAGSRLTSKDECPHCRINLRCCLNCRFYDTGKPNKCAEPQADRVANKDKANYCNYFEPASDSDSSYQESAREKSRKQFDDLFNKK